jgi:UDP-N-acetylglucosamine pyrophosphorylase
MDQRQNLKIIMLRLVVSGYINCPSENSSTIITSGGNVAANNTNGNASYLKSNGVVLIQNQQQQMPYTIYTSTIKITNWK